MKKVLLFVNPSARRGRRCREDVERVLAGNGWLRLNSSCDPRGGNLEREIARHGRRADAIIIGGGDGSVNRALPALLESGLPVLVLALGTANNLARTLGLPRDVPSALALLRDGEIRRIDVGLANGIPFLGVVGLGLSTQVNRLVRTDLKRWLGVIAFAWTALKVVRRMTPFKVAVFCDGWTHAARSWQVTVCNGRNYGAGLTIHEDATLNDRTLHGLSTEVEKWWRAFRLIPALMFGRFRPHHDVTVFSGEDVRIVTRSPMKVDVDGDVRTRTPLEIRVMPKALPVFVPRNTASVAPARDRFDNRKDGHPEGTARAPASS